MISLQEIQKVKKNQEEYKNMLTSEGQVLYTDIMIESFGNLPD